MKIVFFAFDFKPRSGGIAEYTHNLAKTVSDLGHEVLVFSKKMDGDKKFDKRVSYSVKRLDSDLVHQEKSILDYYYEYKYLSNELSSVDPDIIVYNCIGPNAEYRMGLLYSKLHSTPLVTLTHGRELSRVDKTDVLKNFLSLYFTDRIVANSSNTKDLLKKYLISDKYVRKITPGIDIDYWNERLSEKYDPPQIVEKNDLDSSPLIFSLGTLTPRKGFDTLIKALPRVMRQIPEINLVIAGKGPDSNRLKNLAEENKVSDSVYFPGFISEKEKPHYYRSADVFAMPCRETSDGDIEGFGIVYLESQICGTPVIGGNEGGASDAILHGKSGYLVEPRDTKELSTNISRILSDENLKQKIAKAGQKFVREEMAWKKKGRKFQSFLSSLDSINY